MGSFKRSLLTYGDIFDDNAVFLPLLELSFCHISNVEILLVFFGKQFMPRPVILLLSNWPGQYFHDLATHCIAAILSPTKRGFHTEIWTLDLTLTVPYLSVTV